MCSVMILKCAPSLLLIFFPFALKGAAKTWYDNLSPRSIKNPKDLLSAFFQKYFPAKAQHAALQNIFNFVQEKGEILPISWARFCSLFRGVITCPLAKNELLHIFYNGLTDESRTYLDSCVGCVFRQRTSAEAEELLAKISKIMMIGIFLNQHQPRRKEG